MRTNKKRVKIYTSEPDIERNDFIIRAEVIVGMAYSVCYKIIHDQNRRQMIPFTKYRKLVHLQLKLEKHYELQHNTIKVLQDNSEIEVSS